MKIDQPEALLKVNSATFAQLSLWFKHLDDRTEWFDNKLSKETVDKLGGFFGYQQNQLSTESLAMLSNILSKSPQRSFLPLLIFINKQNNEYIDQFFKFCQQDHSNQPELNASISINIAQLEQLTKLILLAKLFDPSRLKVITQIIQTNQEHLGSIYE